MAWLASLTIIPLAVVVSFWRQVVAALRRVEQQRSAPRTELQVPFPAERLAAQRESIKKAQAKARELSDAFTERWRGPEKKRQTPEEEAECLRAERESTYEYRIALVEERKYCEMLRANACVRLGQERLLLARRRVLGEDLDRRMAELMRFVEAEKAGCFLSGIIQRDAKVGTKA